ncbi:MAG: HD domain-containing protein, partial [Thermoplasmata archaeon]
MKYKTIHDPIHGSIKMEGSLLDLLETPEVQKLHGIHQLGLAYLVFPGAHHTRLEHSLGVCHFAKRMAEELNLSKEEKLTVQAAGLLHDLGHGPYSHTLEHVLHMKLGIDHMELTKDIITGKHDSIKDFNDGRYRIHEILEKAGLDPKKVASLVTGEDNENNFELFSKESTEKRYLAQIIHSPIDADQIDYLLRDSHYTGVAAGTIDNHRLLQTLALHNGELVITKGGINALEGMLVARALMYSTVYFHKTVRIAEGML